MRLTDFIIEAKRSGYASGGETDELRLDDGAFGFIYQADEFRYIDRYYGFNPFSGSEVVFENDASIWSMNYYGASCLPIEETKELYSFLKNVMLLITPEYPFRGPAKHIDGIYEYNNRHEGSIAKFNGIEAIQIDNEKVYHLWYHGGIVYCFRSRN